MEKDWYTEEINTQTKIRIKLAMAAYAYEVLGKSMISDAEYDDLSKKVDLSVDTRRPDLDKFFREEFSSSTGMWIYRHPDIQRITYLTERYYDLV